MGANMARRLKDRGFHVTAVYDTNRAAATELASELGCAAAQDLSEVTAASDVIFTVVTDDDAMRQIFAGPGDNLLVNARGKLFVNCATIHPRTHVEVARRAHAAGAVTLEACMASSIPQARNGTLYLMCGGEKAAFDRVKPILENPKFFDVNEASQGPFRKAWEALVNVAAKILENRETNQVATQVPLRGEYENPRVGLIEAILNLLRNAFVAAFAHSLEGTVSLRDVAEDVRTQGGVEAPPPEENGSNR